MEADGVTRKASGLQCDETGWRGTQAVRDKRDGNADAYMPTYDRNLH